MGSLTSHNPIGLQGLLRDIYHIIYTQSRESLTSQKSITQIKLLTLLSVLPVMPYKNDALPIRVGNYFTELCADLVRILLYDIPTPEKFCSFIV
jgi:hypothetical protein